MNPLDSVHQSTLSTLDAAIDALPPAALPPFSDSFSISSSSLFPLSLLEQQFTQHFPQEQSQQTRQTNQHDSTGAAQPQELEADKREKLNISDIEFSHLLFSQDSEALLARADSSPVHPRSQNNNQPNTNVPTNNQPAQPSQNNQPDKPEQLLAGHTQQDFDSFSIQNLSDRLESIRIGSFNHSILDPSFLSLDSNLPTLPNPLTIEHENNQQTSNAQTNNPQQIQQNTQTEPQQPTNPIQPEISKNSQPAPTNILESAQNTHQPQQSLPKSSTLQSSLANLAASNAHLASTANLNFPEIDAYRPLAGIPTDENARAVVSALRTLQERVGKLEGEKSAAKDRIQDLERELSTTRKLLLFQQQQFLPPLPKASQNTETSNTQTTIAAPDASSNVPANSSIPSVPADAPIPAQNTHVASNTVAYIPQTTQTVLNVHSIVSEQPEIANVSAQVAATHSTDPQPSSNIAQEYKPLYSNVPSLPSSKYDTLADIAEAKQRVRELKDRVERVRQLSRPDKQVPAASAQPEHNSASPTQRPLPFDTHLATQPPTSMPISFGAPTDGPFGSAPFKTHPFAPLPSYTQAFMYPYTTAAPNTDPTTTNYGAYPSNANDAYNRHNAAYPTHSAHMPTYASSPYPPPPATNPLPATYAYPTQYASNAYPEPPTAPVDDRSYIQDTEIQFIQREIEAQRLAHQAQQTLDHADTDRQYPNRETNTHRDRDNTVMKKRLIERVKNDPMLRNRAEQRVSTNDSKKRKSKSKKNRDRDDGESDKNPNGIKNDTAVPGSDGNVEPDTGAFDDGVIDARQAWIDELLSDPRTTHQRQDTDASDDPSVPKWTKVPTTKRRSRSRKSRSHVRDQTVSSSMHIRRRPPINMPQVINPSQPTNSTATVTDTNQPLGREMPFIVGTSTGKSFSVTANLQRVFSLLKAHNPGLCSVCSKRHVGRSGCRESGSGDGGDVKVPGTSKARNVVHVVEPMRLNQRAMDLRGGNDVGDAGVVLHQSSKPSHAGENDDEKPGTKYTDVPSNLPPLPVASDTLQNKSNTKPMDTGDDVRVETDPIATSIIGDGITTSGTETLRNVLSILEDDFRSLKRRYHHLVTEYEQTAETATMTPLVPPPSSLNGVAGGTQTMDLQLDQYRALKLIGDELRTVISTMETKGDQIRILREIVESTMVNRYGVGQNKLDSNAGHGGRKMKGYEMPTMTWQNKMKDNALRIAAAEAFASAATSAALASGQSRARSMSPVLRGRSSTRHTHSNHRYGDDRDDAPNTDKYNVPKWTTSVSRSRSPNNRALASLSLLKSSIKVQDALADAVA